MTKAVQAFDNLVDQKLPPSDEEAKTYFGLAGAGIVVAAWAADQTAAWIEKGGGSNKLEIAATIGATCLPAVFGSVFWRQGWRSVGETENL